MRTTFKICHPWVLAHEGGYVNHPEDPGGATNQGITQSVYDAWRINRGKSTQSVKLLTDADRDTIYRSQYWSVIRGDSLPLGVDYAVYDFAVNSGPARAAKFLQRLVGVTPDGIIGNLTLAAVAKHPDHVELIKELCYSRYAWLKRLRHWSTFGSGWTRRVLGYENGVQSTDTGVIDRAVRLALREEELAKKVVIIPEEGAPKASGPERIMPQARDLLGDLRAISGAGVAGAGSIVTALSGATGPVAWAIAVAVVAAVLLATYLLLQESK